MLGCLSCVAQREKGELLNSFKLFLLSNQKHPPYHPTFQSYISQVSHTIQLYLHPLLSFLASFLKIMVKIKVYYGQLIEAKN